MVLSACNVELFTNLDQRQANEIVATLFRKGIPAERMADKTVGRYSIKVDSGSFAQAVSVLNENGLPRQEFATMCDVFKKDSLVVTPAQERAQTICATGQELSRTVSEIDGVLSARVHLVLPENDQLRQTSVPSSASVFIRHKSNVPVANLMPQVKQLVANSISGLAYDKVSVVLVPVEADQAVNADTQDMSNVLGVWVHGKSAARASVLIYGLLLGLLAAVGALVFVMRNNNNVYPLDKGRKS